MIWLFACAAPPPPPPPAGPPEVVALSEPAAWLVERLAGDAVTLTRFTPPGEDPPHFRPAPAAISALAEADLVVGVGAGYEAWTAQAMLPPAVWLADGVPLIEQASTEHQHGGSGAHSHGAVDPHVFGDPQVMADAACRFGKALEALGATGAHKRCEPLAAELVALSQQQAAALAPWRGHTLSANHPSYGYLARRHEVFISSLDLDPEVVTEVPAVPGQVLFWESEPDAAWRAALPDVHQVVVDPLEQAGPDGYDYLTQARANVAVFEALPSPH